ncbi:CNP1-like family protein [Ramlibacter sp.]|uniref:CNP1-like family protein n=1 Tax=Ramlibacter sp. TaxID=1917967 RepID=UPI003D0B3562
MHRRLAAPALALALSSLAAPAALAQLFGGDRNWQEIEAPPPPALRVDGLVPVEVPRSTLRFGIDPESISVGSDSVVRYVVVARSREGGAVNAIYEGVHCGKADVKVYARHSGEGGWRAVGTPEWRSLYEPKLQPHSLAIARAGVCHGTTPNANPTKILRDLRAPVDQRFGDR